MKAVSHYSPYGWEAKIGLIVPSLNAVMEPELWQMAPPGVSVLTARAMLQGATTMDSYQQMAQAVAGAADQLATTDVDIVAFGCTSGSFVCPLEPLLDTMRVRTGKPALAAAGAIVSALQALEATRVSLVTPYLPFVNDREVAFLADYGIETVRLASFNLGETAEERRCIGRVPPEAIYRLAREADDPQAQALFISCTNLPSLRVVAQLEDTLGKPVITSNQATFWACLRRLGLTLSLPGYGRLLSDCLAPLGDAPGVLPSPVPA